MINDECEHSVFQLPDEEVMTFFRVQARVKGSYEIVLCAIMKQVKHFQETGYRDGRIGTEMVFEKALQVCQSSEYCSLWMFIWLTDVV